jgi:chemotaxis protein CheX
MAEDIEQQTLIPLSVKGKKMDATYITAFVESVQHVFSTMLQTEVKVAAPTIRDDSEPSFDVSSVISMSGDITGTVVLSFPTDCAERLVSVFIGMEVDADNEDFADAIGELINMIAGNAKVKFEGKTVSIGIPSVVIGKNHRVFPHKDVPIIDIPCSCDFGQFVVEVGIKDTVTSETLAPVVASASA